SPTSAPSPLPLHDALPIFVVPLQVLRPHALSRPAARHRLGVARRSQLRRRCRQARQNPDALPPSVCFPSRIAQVQMDPVGSPPRSEEHTSELQSLTNLLCP